MFFLFGLILLIQQAVGSDQILLALTPLITWFVGYLVNKIKAWITTKGINGTLFIGITFPIISLFGTWLTTLIVPGTSWLIGFLIGLGGVFINQILKQVGQSITGTQDAIEPTITSSLSAQQM